MNRGGGFQSFLVQQMTMGGNPSSWWASNMNSNSVRAAAALVDQEEAANSLLPSSSPSPSSVFPHHQFQSLQPSSHLLPTNQDLPESWSQLLLQGGLGGGEEYSCRYGSNNPFQAKDHEMEMYQAGSEHMGSSTVKQEISSENAYAYSKPQWSQMLQASSPRSCVTSTASFNSNMLDFSNNKPPELGQGHHQQPENSSECNSTTSGSAFKKARVQGSSPLQSTFKVRKEKLGDRITALHQIVSPFGKCCCLIIYSFRGHGKFPRGGLGGGEEYSCRYGSNNPFQAKDHEMEMYQAGSEHMGSSTVKQEISSENAYAYSKPQWSQMLQASSPRSCVTSTASFNSNMLDFSNNKPPELGQGHHQQPENSSECNSTTSGSAFKKARVQGSSPLQSTFKVRKEKLGDRITALHQIVSPFGKTDTASVLLEAIGYIRFLLSQIEALSSPYLASGSGNTRHPGQGERNCIFPEDPGQLLQDNTTKKRVSPEQGFDNETKNKDLRTRGLCLVPVSCTLHVGGGSAADFWAPNALGGGF
ncbi:transcription factor bHLH68-like [Ananas comosus]|uniref:Transcription factor bHLH68-like n=1 Tax=Ananas comosus TaxID=4615 RepID=A0A6P5FWD7_ANACO|nr:transcription factor bHLH68-like [Ananas comosus]